MSRKALLLLLLLLQNGIYRFWFFSDLAISSYFLFYRDKLDTLVGEKARIDATNEEIDIKLDSFHQRYEKQLHEFDVMS